MESKEDYRCVLKGIESLAYIQRAPKAGKLLDCLAEHKNSGHPAGIKTLAENLFRGERLPKDGGVNAVRTLVYRVRVELRDYFTSNPIGVASDYRIDIRQAHGGYELITTQKRTSDNLDHFEWFWGPYLRSKIDPIIQSCARVFLAFGDNIYFRDVTKQQGGEVDDLFKWLGVDPEVVDQKLKQTARKSRHFVSAGETCGMLHLTDAFLGRNRIIRFGNLPRYGKSRGDVNLIQVGLPRNDDRTIYNMIQGEHFFLTPKGVCEQNNNEILYQEEPFQPSLDDPFDDKVAAAERYVILTRLPNSDPKYSLTAITSNHGRATEAVCKLLSNDSQMGSLIQCLSSSGESQLLRFQVVFRVKLVRQGEREIDRETSIVTARSNSPSESPATRDDEVRARFAISAR